MYDKLQTNRSDKSLLSKNYDFHYEKLLNIMHSSRKITLSKSSHPRKKFIKSQTNLTHNNTPGPKYAQKTQVNVGTINQKTKRVFDKSLFARSLFPNQHYFHITKSNKFLPNKDTSIKKISYYKHKNEGKIIKLMMVIRFLDTKIYCKNSNFVIQIQPYGLRSPILAHNELSKDAIGFKFKHRQNQDFYVSLFQIRGNNQYLVMKSNKQQDFNKFKLDVQTKVVRTVKQIVNTPAQIQRQVDKQEYQEKKFQLSTKCRISIETNQKHQNIYSFSKQRQKSHAERRCIKNSQVQVQKKNRMTNTNFFTSRSSNIFKQSENDKENVVLMKLD